jgi:predicted AAA+ superfamily ATPase
MIQHYHQRYGSAEQALYLSADNIIVISHGLFEIADTYFKLGGKALYIDEIHKYPDWSLELKNIIDIYSDRQIIISGSSTLDLTKSKGDLSRRMVYYTLRGLSFREYLNLELGTRWQSYPLEHLLVDHAKLASEIIQGIDILKYFAAYLVHGYYPFYLEGKNEYSSRLNNVIEKVICEDIASSYNLAQSKLPVLKKLLWLICSSEPMTPNIDRISKDLGVARESIYHYIEYLDQAGIIINLQKGSRGLKSVRKPAKIYMENTGLILAISERISPKQGTLRETFFANQLTAVARLTIPEQGDFLVNDQYCFEVGGKHKTNDQIKGVENAALALDGIEIGFKNTLPLWLFGFLY